MIYKFIANLGKYVTFHEISVSICVLASCKLKIKMRLGYPVQQAGTDDPLFRCNHNQRWRLECTSIWKDKEEALNSVLCLRGEEDIGN